MASPRSRSEAKPTPATEVAETIDWIKRLRDMRRLAETKEPSVFLPPPPRDFVGRAEALETLYTLLAEADAGSGPESSLFVGSPCALRAGLPIF
jgi:hypothetical protein